MSEIYIMQKQWMTRASELCFHPNNDEEDDDERDEMGGRHFFFGFGAVATQTPTDVLSVWDTNFYPETQTYAKSQTFTLT